ncbi:MAG: Gfo/Idh/MocA family oxidoreductase [Meiothermus sp.]|nr:Gfo/Idh/MocA family oxidoreductase [Meiothermus sp.]
MRVAIAGVGVAGGWYAGIVRGLGGVELVAAMRSRGGDTGAIECGWGVPCFTTWEEVLLQKPDVLIVATPSGLHYAQAKAALEAGVHVLVDKPLTLKVEEALELVALARRHNRRLGVLFPRRSDPVYQAVKQALDSGVLGQPVLLSITMPYYRSPEYYRSAAWRGTWALDGGGILMNQGIHLVDLALWWLGRAVQVNALSATLTHTIEVEDTVAVNARFENGALLNLCGTTASQPGSAHTLELCGTRGSLRIEGEQVVRWDVPGFPRPEADPDTPTDRQVSLAGHRRIIEDFIGAVREERDPLVSGAEGVKSLEFVEAAYASAQTRRIIENI